jgi:hypothetical protein
MIRFETSRKRLGWLFCRVALAVAAMVSVDATHGTAREPSTPDTVSPAVRAELLAVREKVWLAWFDYDPAALERLLPSETLGINAGEAHWENRQEIIENSRRFKEAGKKMVKLSFPRTQIQLFGDTAILYSEYKYEILASGRQQAVHGRATEIFVKGSGRWVNPGWHLDSEE